MHEILSAAPCQELNAYVRAFAQREIRDLTADIVHPAFALLEPVLQFDFYNAPIVEFDNGMSVAASRISVVGPHTGHEARIRLKGSIDTFAIFFQPFGLWQLFQIPARRLINQAYSGDEVFGTEIKQLWEEMAGDAAFGQRVQAAQKYLLRWAANAVSLTPVMRSAIHLFHRHGAPKIGDLANHTALGIRQFERRFTDEVGMAPKLFARVTRYQMALDAKVACPQRSWMDIAHAFGYHDQMHMIRDFESLTGESPGRMLMQLGAIRPESLAHPADRSQVFKNIFPE